MGQEHSSENRSQMRDDDTDAIFEAQESKKFDEKFKEAVRISNYDHSGKGEQMELSQITGGENSDVLKKQITLLANHNTKEILEEHIYEGILKKMSPTVFSNWQPRYCILSDKRFIYKQSDKKDSNDAGILNFNLLSCFVVLTKKPEKDDHFIIKIEKSQKQFVFKAENQQKTALWAKQLKKVTDESFGKKHSLTYLTNYYRFWRKQYLSEADFRDQSETGDLVLMRGKGKSSTIQRAITLQQFDHIALVLKNIKHQVVLFEATGGIGVGIVPWKKFISKKWFQNQQIVVYRKLHIERTQELINDVQSFVERNMGRKYKFSVKKYFMNRQSHEKKQDKKSYFCSSLIAKLFKDIELLDPKVSSTQYLPSSFSEKNSLKLNPDGKYGKAYLQREKIIVFQNLFFDQTK